MVSLRYLFKAREKKITNAHSKYQPVGDNSGSNPNKRLGLGNVMKLSLSHPLLLDMWSQVFDRTSLMELRFPLRHKKNMYCCSNTRWSHLQLLRHWCQPQKQVWKKWEHPWYTETGGCRASDSVLFPLVELSARVELPAPSLCLKWLIIATAER